MAKEPKPKKFKPRRPAGQGTIQDNPRKDGRYVAALTLLDGKRKFFYGKTKEEAADKMYDAQLKLRGGRQVLGKNPLLKDFATVWLEDVARPTVKESTHLRYTQLLSKHVIPILGKYRLDKITPQYLNMLYTMKLEEGLAPRHVGHIHRLLHTALKTALRWEYVSRNICDLVDPPRVPKAEQKSFTPEQARTFLGAIQGDRLEALYILALTTGFRAGELRGLHWDDIDFEKGVLHLRRSMRRIHGIGWVESDLKNPKKRRQVPLIEPAIDALRRHRTMQLEERLKSPEWKDENRVFTSINGNPIDDSYLAQKSFRPLLIKAGLPEMRLHDIRHSVASILLAYGVGLKMISEILGHANISITADTYTHVSPALHREALENLNRLFKR